MSRPSSIVLLCEDRMQASLVYAYLNKCDYKTARCVTRRVASEIGKPEGGNIGWVLREFSMELQACRQRNQRARTMLIVVADADTFAVDERRGHLKADPPVVNADPLVVLIPRRHVETWIRAALDLNVNETDNYKRPEPKKSEVRAAATSIHGWARSQPQPGPTCVLSLLAGLLEWRKIG